MTSHLTLIDLIYTSIAFVVFPLFLVVPGYVLGYLLNLVEFRSRTPLLRLLLSLPLSIALTPVLVYLLGRLFSTSAIIPFYAVLWLAFLGMLLYSSIRPSGPQLVAFGFPRGTTRALSLLVGGWVIVGLLSLVDLQFGHKLFFTAASYDYTVRSSVVGQLARISSLPPTSPFFFAGHPAPLRYHYFWFLLSSLPVRLLPSVVEPRHALFAGIIWAGLALASTVALYLRLFSERGTNNLKRRTYIGLGLLCISGLDILPNLFLDFVPIKGVHRVYATVDWWNGDQVTGWLDSVLWVPHHLSALLACMTGFLILWRDKSGQPVKVRWTVALGAGLAFASAGGLSVYVTFAFSAFLIAWILISLLRNDRQTTTDFIAAGLIAAAIGLPFVRDLAAVGSSGTTDNASFLVLHVRRFTPVHIGLQVLHLDRAHITSLLDLLFLPLNYFMELGALFVIGGLKWMQWRKTRKLSPSDVASLTLLSVCLFIATFLRSNTIQNNDLGWRSMLFVQFVLTIWGADLLADLSWNRERQRTPAFYLRAAVLTTVLLGAATNIYELFMLRSFAILTEAGMDPVVNNITSGPKYGEQALANRQMYEWLNKHVPAGAVEQHNPVNEYNPLPGLYSNRQMGMMDVYAAAAFGGSPAESKVMENALRKLYQTDWQAADPKQICSKYKIDYLIARSDDPAWQDPNSWVWKARPIYSNALTRAFSCSSL
jgi:hypothetical protein